MGEKLNDNEILYMIFGGVEEGYDLLFQKYTKVIWAIINTYHFNYQSVNDKQDVYQLCCTTLVDAVFTFREDKQTSFGHYFRTCAKRTILGYFRRQFQQNNFTQHSSISLDASVGDNNELYGVDIVENNQVTFDPEWVLNFNYVAEEKTKLYQDFNEKEIAILEYKIQGYSYGEIAEMLEVSYKKVDNTIQRFKKKSRQLIDYTGTL
ncbi:MAG: sigma-70 family RNA polymerase sigma factor [Erysipelotrichaceae bacterium]